jgi:hypothetical protein
MAPSTARKLANIRPHPWISRYDQVQGRREKGEEIETVISCYFSEVGYWSYIMPFTWYRMDTYIYAYIHIRDRVI